MLIFANSNQPFTSVILGYFFVWAHYLTINFSSNSTVQISNYCQFWCANNFGNLIYLWVFQKTHLLVYTLEKISYENPRNTIRQLVFVETMYCYINMRKNKTRKKNKHIILNNSYVRRYSICYIYYCINEYFYIVSTNFS